jgi:hypothetical protein
MIRREQRRLDRAFAALVAAVAPAAAAAQACSQDSTWVQSTDAGRDVTTSDRGTGPGSDDVAQPVVDAGGPDRICGYSLTVLDSGTFDADGALDPACEYTLPCGLPPNVALIGCDLYVAGPDGAPQMSPALGCRLVEGQGCLADAYAPTESGAVTFTCLDCLGGSGRRPLGLARLARVRAPNQLGARFARASHDEAASVAAFVRMRAELARHGAPSALVSAAERAARDEVRHARMMEAHARACGARVPSPRIRKKTAPRTLEAIARENAVEGCVAETMGALLARWQAAHARTPGLREDFAKIAADEARHAALSWAVARWAEDRLDDRARARVARARARAIERLRKDARRRSSSPVDLVLGAPSRAQRIALVEGLIEALALG